MNKFYQNESDRSEWWHTTEVGFEAVVKRLMTRSVVVSGSTVNLKATRLPRGIEADCCSKRQAVVEDV